MILAIRFLRNLCTVIVPALMTCHLAHAQPAAVPESVRTVLKQYCLECHQGDQAEAEIDLAQFESIEQVRSATKIWQRVHKMLVSRQMPPKDSAHPNDDEHQRLSSWVRDFLQAEATAQAGDPGPVTLRRLNNAEYTYTIRDLTGIASLDPTKEFPIDGAAGEGFNNTGDALGMSPSLVNKYLLAAKEIAQHMVLMPDGVRFSRQTTPRDWTDAALNEIRQFYFQFADDRGKFLDWEGKNANTPRNGRIPLADYIGATIANRDALRAGSISIERVARQNQLSPKYLAEIWSTLNGTVDQGFLLNDLRDQWQATSDVTAIVTYIERWQHALWQFHPIGHLGRKGAPKHWMTPKDSTVVRKRLKLELPAAKDDAAKDDTDAISIYLTAVGATGDDAIVAWRSPRIQLPGRPPILLRDVSGAAAGLAQQRTRFLADLPKYLAVASELAAGKSRDEVAQGAPLNDTILQNLLAYLGIGSEQPVVVDGHFTESLDNIGGYNFVAGWGSSSTPSVVANASDQAVRIPGNLASHSVVVHPSPTVFAAVGWQSPVTAKIEIDADVADAHPECGNGFEWILQHRSSSGTVEIERGDIATGGTKSVRGAQIEVAKGDLVSILVGPRSGQHACDLTSVKIVLREEEGSGQVWDLGTQVSGRILDGNPLADSQGNQSVWHFYGGDVAGMGGRSATVIPAGSLLAKWKQQLTEKDRLKQDLAELAVQIQRMAKNDPPPEDSPDAIVYKHLHQMVGIDSLAPQDVSADERFGRHPQSAEASDQDLFTTANHTTEFRIPASLAAGGVVLVDVECESQSSLSAVQVSATLAPPESFKTIAGQPILVSDDEVRRQPIIDSLHRFRELFPAALCYTKIVPVDEVVTLQLYYREDHHFKRLMCDDEQAATLDRLWDELYFVAQEPLASQVALEQLHQFSTQDRPDLVPEFETLKSSYGARADAFRQRLIDTEPIHLESLINFAGRAWRRALIEPDRQRLRETYSEFRLKKLTHDESIRLLLARVLVAPSFLYRLEEPGPGKLASDVSDHELASRLSYFLWSSTPDPELLAAAESGELSSNDAIDAQAKRMLSDEKIRRMAIHFACQWLHLRDFDQAVEKNERLYPDFAGQRSDFYEETVRFFTDMFQNDGSILDLIDSDYTFVNQVVAKHYGIDGISGAEWQRVDGMRSRGRGGILGMATVLASQSGASRTSPILRGNWVYETLLGERLPKPPPGVPVLPEMVPEGKTARELIQLHSGAPECAKCHQKIDPYGFALEQFDAAGRLRPTKVDTKTTLPDGQSIDGLEGLREYLMEQRRSDIVQQFCRKLLGYALGRETQLSDQPLLDQMQERLHENDYRFSIAVESVVTSPQFRQIRGRLAQDH